MYKIGDFSKIVGIPIRTLRFYDQYKVLQPSVVDNFTGYRYYSEENINKCEMIKLLKSLDFTLEEIVQYKNCLNEDIINKKKNEIEDKIYLLKLKYEKLLELGRKLHDSKKLAKIHNSYIRKEN